MDFDLFLSHNADEKSIVKRVAERLLDEFSIRCWLDEWDLAAGTEWDVAIERALRQCRAVAIFLGPAGWGESQLREARAALELARETPRFLVIPVLLPGATAEAMAVLGDFFSRKHRIELTGGDALRRLALAVRGEAHGPPVMTPFLIVRDSQRWRTSYGDRSLLYRGAALQEAQQLAMSSAGDLDDAALNFLSASTEEEKQALERERKRGRRIIATLTVMVVALTATTLFALAQRRAAQHEATRAIAQQRVADEQRRIADARRLQVTAQMHRASAANLMELGQRLYGDEPLTALRLAAEAMVRVRQTDKVLAGRALTSLREMVAAGRLSRIAVSAEKPIAVAGTDFFIINEATGSTLRRRFDGSVAARLPLKAERVFTDDEAGRYFLVRYGNTQQELRRKRDGSLVSPSSVDSLIRQAPSFTIIKYSSGETELRLHDRDTVAIPLPTKDAEVKASSDARLFAIEYSEGPVVVESGRMLNSNARVALFDSRNRRVPLPTGAAAVSFDPLSDRYVVAYQEANGEIRSTTSDKVIRLPAPVGIAVFAGGRLFVTYQPSASEMRDRDGHLLATWPGTVTHVETVAGTERALVTLLWAGKELVDLRTGERKETGVTGTVDTQYTPRDAGPLQYFVAQRYQRDGVFYDIHSTATGEKVFTTEVLGGSHGTPWVVTIEGEHPLLFNLADGRRVPMPNAGFDRILRGTIYGVTPNQPHVSLYGWRGIPLMVVGSLPSEIRRVSDGSLVTTMPALCEFPTLSPDAASFAASCDHILRQYEGGERNVRTVVVVHSARTGRRIAAFRSPDRGLQFTAHGTLAFIASTAEVHDLRGGRSATGRSLQVSDRHDWLAVQYGTTRSELWHDAGPESPRNPVARLPDGAILIGADVTGRRIVIWEPNGATLLLAGDLLASGRRNPPATPEAVLHAACELISAFPTGHSELDRFALGEPLRACGGSSRLGG